jgi:hypothetical protein
MSANGLPIAHQEYGCRQEIRHPSINRRPNLGDYLRSSAAVTFNTGNHTSAIPVGLGLGR